MNDIDKPTFEERIENIQEMLSLCHLEYADNSRLRNLLLQIALSVSRLQTDKKSPSIQKLQIDWNGRTFDLGNGRTLRQVAEEICKQIVIDADGLTSKRYETAALLGCSPTTLLKYVKESEG